MSYTSTLWALGIRIIRRRLGFWLRCLLCWGIGFMIVALDESKSYDLRFKLRGDQAVSDQIVLILLKQSEMASLYSTKDNLLNHLADLSEINDVQFWNKNLWAHLLAAIIKQNPKSVGVTLFFGEHLHSSAPTDAETALFHDSRIIWAAPESIMDRVFIPILSNPSGSNLGNYDLYRDEDGSIRHLLPNPNPHLIEKMLNRRFPTSPEQVKSQGLLTLNYRGPTRIFKQYFLSDILAGNIPQDAFQNKYILIGRELDRGHGFMTPQGYLSKAEIFAHLMDNHLMDRWIERLPVTLYGLLLFVFMSACVFIITSYPQGIALFFLLFFAGLSAALSAWVFDSFYIWTPIFAPLVILISGWIIFIGYQANKLERLHFRLKQEQKSMQELEQLKNNFVSLISHDLKTPLAKIQAILDRLLTQSLSPEVQRDLIAIRHSGEELNKYIRSILQVLRIESRDIKLHKEVADINEIIREVIEQIRPLAEEKSILIETNLEPMFSVEFDITLLKEVILNLIDNAIKYSKSGQAIQVISYEVDEHIVVEVIDNGDGIRAEELNSVWNKFTRGKDQDLKSKGSGLGLYLVRYFIELHSGHVLLESKVGQGTKVGFRLPISSDRG